MAWTYRGVRIFTQESKEDGAQIIPRLQPLAGNTVLQIFGYEGQIRTINGLIVGNTDKATLMGARATGAAHNLVTPEGETIGYYVKSVSFNREMVICQTIRPDLDSDAPVYTVELQLYKDE